MNDGTRLMYYELLLRAYVWWHLACATVGLKGRGRLGRGGVREEKGGAGGKGRGRGLAQTGRLQVLNGWFTTAKWVVYDG